jgi:hypothetical protein
MCAPPGFPLPAFSSSLQSLSEGEVSCLLAYTVIRRALGSIAPITSCARATMLHLTSVCHRAVQLALQRGMFVLAVSLHLFVRRALRYIEPVYVFSPCLFVTLQAIPSVPHFWSRSAQSVTTEKLTVHHHI